MYNKKELFANIQGLQVPVNVTLSDGREYLRSNTCNRTWRRSSENESTTCYDKRLLQKQDAGTHEL